MPWGAAEPCARCSACVAVTTWGTAYIYFECQVRSVCFIGHSFLWSVGFLSCCSFSCFFTRFYTSGHCRRSPGLGLASSLQRWAVRANRQGRVPALLPFSRRRGVRYVNTFTPSLWFLPCTSSFKVTQQSSHRAPRVTGGHAACSVGTLPGSCVLRELCGESRRPAPGCRFGSEERETR